MAGGAIAARERDRSARAAGFNQRRMIDPRLQREIIEAVRRRWSLDQIEEALIDPAYLGEEKKAAPWLYADALKEQPPGEREPALIRG